MRNVIFAPSRMRWVVNPKKKLKGCLFCRIAKGDKKVPQKVLYRDEHVIVLMNIFPYNTGHLQVIPVRHVENLEDLSTDEICNLFTMVQKATRLLKKVLRPKGFNIGINIGGEIAGASVNHLHVHIVPRYERDFGFMEVIAETKVLPESLEQTFEKLKKEVDMLK